MKTKNLLALGALLLGLQLAGAQGTTFTYQGRLTSDANPANGSYDLTFALFSANSGPGQLGITQTNLATSISNGLFTVALDFGANFSGTDRWLEIAARTNGGGAFTTLSPRQKITPTPYAMYSANAATAATAGTVSGTVPAANLTGTLLDAQLSGNVALLNRSPQTFSGANNFLANVGIGTATPGARLEINQNYTGGTAGMIHLQSSGTEAGLTLEKTNGGTQRYSVKLVNGAGGLGIRDETAGGAIRLQILNTNGNVGIGTVSPAKKLQVGDTSILGSEGMIRLGSHSPSNTATARAWDIGVPQTGENVSGAGYSFAISDTSMPGGPQFMIKYGSGYVGVGNTNPTAKLHVAGGSAGAVTAISDSVAVFERSTHAYLSILTPTISEAGIIFGNPSTALAGGLFHATRGLDIRTGGNTTRMIIEAGGNVGIGTQTPAAMLDVNGTVRASGVTTTLGGLVIETRTGSDPASPAPGRIWLRTDL